MVNVDFLTKSSWKLNPQSRETIMIRHELITLLTDSVIELQGTGALPEFEVPPFEVMRPPSPDYGDYATSVALRVARIINVPPGDIARLISQKVAPNSAIDKIDISPQGYINFRLSNKWIVMQLKTILDTGESKQTINLGRGQKVQVEYVSANPTGPLTIGSARNAVFGDTLANILESTGYDIQREYYINDAGSQIRHLGESVYSRYAELFGFEEALPEGGYHGEYIRDIANFAADKFDRKLLSLPRSEAIRILSKLAMEINLEEARDTLARMHIKFDSWKSERSLYESGLFDQIILLLQSKQLIYTEDDAIWFRAREFGLQKDAVLVRSPSVISDPEERPTYLASDVAYLWDKLVLRNFDRAIYVWGADHHGDLPRVKAAARALDIDPTRLEIILYQLVTLKRGGEVVRMSKRSGDFVTLKEVIEEVGADAIRFNLLTRSHDNSMDFDLDLARQTRDENPVYYVQYAHARIVSILRNVGESDLLSNEANLLLLTHPLELALIRAMLNFEDVMETSARMLSPHHLTQYAIDLAGKFHSFYVSCRVLPSSADDVDLSRARIALVRAARIILARTLHIIGVAAPDSM